MSISDEHEEEIDANQAGSDQEIHPQHRNLFDLNDFDVDTKVIITSLIWQLYCL